MKSEVEVLKQLAEANGTTASKMKSTVEEKESFLYQNQPNPFSDKTTIKVWLNGDASNAAVRISSMQGEIVKVVPISGKGDVTIDIDSLSAGSYFYTLIVNGKIIDSKKMVVID
jgi:hypothetical protein